MQLLYVFRVLLVLVAIRSSECCSCLSLHPQSFYCFSDFVIKVLVTASEVIEDDASSSYSFDYGYTQRTIVYDVYIEAVYKGSNLASPNTNVKISSSSYASCEPVNLQVNQNYVVMGFSRKDGLEIESCGYHKPSIEVTKRQFQGFKRTYEKTCDLCSICGPYGCDYPISKNGYCTMEFSYYGYYDEGGQCETDFARCGMNKKGQCVWLGCHDYRHCKKQK